MSPSVVLFLMVSLSRLWSSLAASAAASCSHRVVSTVTNPRPHSQSLSSSIQPAVRRSYRSPLSSALRNSREEQVQLQVPPHEPTLEELQSQLPPLARILSNTIELTIVTLGSYISGGILGYLFTGIINLPSTLFFNTGSPAFLTRLSQLHQKSWSKGRNWGMLSGAFSGCQNFVRMLRGTDDQEDGWNAVWGSALTGAFLNRAGGTRAMIQGAASYAGFTYFLNKIFSPPNPSHNQQGLLYTDIPIDD